MFKQKSWLETLVEFSVGADVVAAIVAGPFYFSGRMKDFWEAVWGFNTSYVASSWHFTLSNPSYLSLVGLWLSSVVMAYGLWLVGLVEVFRRGWKEFRSRVEVRPHAFMGCWFGLALLGCSLSGRFTNYYFLVLLAPMAVTGGILGAEVQRRFKWWPLVMVIAIAPLAVGYYTAWRGGVSDLQAAWYPVDRLLAAKAVGLEIKKLAKPEDELLSWTTEPEIYVYAGLPMSTIKTPLVNHLVEMPNYLDAQREHFVANPPRFLVLSNFSQVFMEPSWLNSVLIQRYKVIESVSPYSIYRLDTKK